jgi:hypothetical protein
VNKVVWSIPRKVWLILLSWGLAVLMIASLLAFWIDRNDRRKDQTMCDILGTLTSGPEPMAGPSGDRSREIIAKMRAHERALDC